MSIAYSCTRRESRTWPCCSPPPPQDTLSPSLPVLGPRFWSMPNLIIVYIGAMADRLRRLPANRRHPPRLVAGEPLVDGPPARSSSSCSRSFQSGGMPRTAHSAGLTSVEGKRGSRICFSFREPCHGRYPHKRPRNCDPLRCIGRRGCEFECRQKEGS